MSQSIIDIIAKYWPIFGAPVLGVAGYFVARYVSAINAASGAKDKLDAREDRMIDRLTEENKALNAKVADLYKEVRKNENELEKIRLLFSVMVNQAMEDVTVETIREIVGRLVHQSDGFEILRLFLQSCPVLIWIKERDAKTGKTKMSQVSSEYAKIYLGGASDLYTGKSDREIWGDAQAAIFAKNDTAAFLNGEGVIHVKEPIHSPLTGVTGWFRGIKWTFFEGEKVYLCGVGVHEETECAETVLGNLTKKEKYEKKT